MAKATRIDSYQELPDGRVLISVTKGSAPLPSDASEVREFQTKQDFMQAIADAEARVAEDLFLMQAGKALKGDPQIGATFKAAFVGKIAVLDLVGTATTLSLP